MMPKETQIPSKLFISLGTSFSSLKIKIKQYYLNLGGYHSQAFTRTIRLVIKTWQ